MFDDILAGLFEGVLEGLLELLFDIACDVCEWAAEARRRPRGH